MRPSRLRNVDRNEALCTRRHGSSRSARLVFGKWLRFVYRSDSYPDSDVYLDPYVDSDPFAHPSLLTDGEPDAHYNADAHQYADPNSDFYSYAEFHSHADFYSDELATAERPDQPDRSNIS